MAARTGATLLEVELICSDKNEHRLRIEARTADIEGHKLPTWEDVVATRTYDPWTRAHLVIDTASHSSIEAVERIRKFL